MKINFDNFQIQKSMSQTVIAQKVDEKMGPFVQFPYVLSELRSLKRPWQKQHPEDTKIPYCVLFPERAKITNF